MKHNILFLLWLSVVLSISHLQAQEWMKNIPAGKENNFFEIRKAFDKYWAPFNVVNGYYIENGIKTKAHGWKIFNRWAYYWESRINQSTGEFPKTSTADEYRKYKELNPFSEHMSSNWTSLGPVSSDGGYAGIGRLNCVSFHPINSNTFWVGAASGGLWKTTNGGTSWITLTDNNVVLGVSDIGVPSDYSTSNTLYVATGDKDGGSVWSLGGGQYHDNESMGVLKSTDGGSSWFETGLAFTVDQKRTVSRIIIHPTNTNVLWAATSVGIYKSVNSGTSWTLLNSGNFIDMEIKPGDPNTLYASTMDYYSTPVIYRTTNGGTNWTNIKTFAASDWRVDMAVTPADPNCLFVIVCNTSSGLSAICKSANSGTSFTTRYTGAANKALLGSYSDGYGNNTGQGSYDLAIAVSPTDTSIIFIGGVNTHKSTNGGSSWYCINCWTSYYVYNKNGAPEVHADQHMLAYQPGTNILFEANDGGIYKTTNGGSGWIDLTNGIVSSQIYRISTGQTGSDEILCGLQDNGSKLKSGSTWSDVTGGDGMDCIVDYTDINVQYASYVYGELYRTTNHWTGSYTMTPSSAGTGHWLTPMTIDPSNNQIIYAGYADVWKSTNRGTDWTKISAINTSSKLRALAVAPSNNQFIYVSDPNQIWRTTNGGAGWSDITGLLPVSTNSITCIAVKHNNPNTVWVSLGGYNNQRVYETTNGGSSWTNISNGLPNLPVMCIIQNKQNSASTELYAGTDRGVYMRTGTGIWQSYNNNLPKVVITDLDIYYDNTIPANSKLRAGTYGRGLWQSPLPAGSSNSLTVTSPNGGESWAAASAHTITWTNTGTILNVKIEYSTNSGSSWINIISNTVNDGSYLWTVPNIATTTGRIRVSDASNASTNDVSDGNFTISASVSNLDYTWSQSTGVYSSITGTIITELDGADDAYTEISIPFGFTYAENIYNSVYISTNGYIGFGAGTSEYNNENLFTADIPLNVISPWWDDLKDDGTGTISYTSTGTLPNRVFIVQFAGYIDYYTGASIRMNFQIKLYESSNTIELCYGSKSGSPGASGSSASIGIKGNTGGSGDFIDGKTGSMTTGNSTLTSAANFPANGTIYRFIPASSGTVTVTSPNGGEYWLAGTAQSIAWTSTGLISNVKIEYSTNSGFSWTSIISSTANDGQYTWTLPNISTIAARVRISDVSNTTLNDASNADFTIWKPLAPTHLIAGSDFKKCIPLNWRDPNGTSLSDNEQIMGLEIFRSDKNTLQSSSLSAEEYRVYRKTGSGGTYSLSGTTNRKDFVDTNLSAGVNYFYRVTAMIDGVESDYSGEVSAICSELGLLINVPCSSGQPLIDGVINGPEWIDAAEINITNTSGYLNDPPGQNASAFMVRNGNLLYIAIKDMADLSRQNYDQIGIYFDKDNDDVWDAGEGNLWIMSYNGATKIQYREITGTYPDNLFFAAAVDNPTGVTAAVQLNNGHMEYEVCINLQTSPLKPFSGSAGMYLYSFDASSARYNAYWPDGHVWPAPQTYADIIFDNQIPELTIGALVSEAVNVFRLGIGGNESLDSLSININSQQLTMQKRGSLHFGNFLIQTNGTLNLHVEAWDLCMNKTTIDTSYTALLLSKNTLFGKYRFKPGSADGYIILRNNQDDLEAGHLVPVDLELDILALKNKDSRLQVEMNYGREVIDRLKEKHADVHEGQIGFYFRSGSQWFFMGGYGSNGKVSAILDLRQICKSGNDMLVFPVIAVFYNPEQVVFPSETALEQNYPNPFNPNTMIRYQLSEDGDVELSIYNILGQCVRTLVQTGQQAGFYQVSWDGTNQFNIPVSSGVYLYRLKSGPMILVKKMIYLK